jgi:UDP-3-O-[3-hydroxymyristoyl] glucosamine N-acyltransferase
MRLTLSEIAERVGGTVRGDGTLVIYGAATLETATEKDISFLGNVKYRAHLKTTRAGALLVSPDVSTEGRSAIVLKNPVYGWARVLEILATERVSHPQGIHPTAVIASGARLGKNVAVGAHTVVEAGVSIGDNTIIYPQVYMGAGVAIGADCLIYPQVIFREGVRVGNRCIFQPGAVIGSDGFGFTPHEGRSYKVPQIGTVEIGDDVEIQANTTIDRATIGVTRACWRRPRS